MIQTRHIELWVHGDKDVRIETWKFLRMLDNTVYRAANIIINEQNFNNYYENRVVNEDGTIININNEIKKLYRKKSKLSKDEFDSELSMLQAKKAEIKSSFYNGKGKSKQNTTYRIINIQFPEIPSEMRSCLNNSIVSVLGKENKDVENGLRSIRSYKKGMPMPFTLKVNSLYQENGEVYLKWFNNIKFQLRFGRDKSNNRIIIDRIINGQYTPSISQIVIKGSKIFLNVCYDFPLKENDLDKNLSIGVDLGINTPAYWALSLGYGNGKIGSKSDFLRIRTQKQRKRRELYSSLKISNGGKGRNKKLKALDKLKKDERNFVHTYNHNLTKELINIAKRTKAGTIKLELLEGFGKNEDGETIKEKEFLLRNWSYYELQSLLEYKAKREGIDILYVDPYHTSQMCALCGHYENGQRISGEFTCKNLQCKNFGKTINADYNAALNIAKSNKIVESKEDCTIYKNKKVSKEMAVGSCIASPNQESKLPYVLM